MHDVHTKFNQNPSDGSVITRIDRETWPGLCVVLCTSCKEDAIADSLHVVLRICSLAIQIILFIAVILFSNSREEMKHVLYVQ
jgi:hypothetical protein